MIFGRATNKNTRLIFSTFDFYGRISGQIVNWNKSKIFLGHHIPHSRVVSLRSLAGMRIGSLPFIYLGVPMFIGSQKKIWLQPLADKVLSNFDNWKGHTLSMAGRIALVNSIIYGSFLYSFMIYKWPSFLLKWMEKALQNFIWTGSIHSKKLVTVKWDVCCSPKEQGGLSLKRLYLINSAMLSKLAWRLNYDD